MRVLHVSAYLPPHIGGVETHVAQLSKHLIGLGNSVDIITTTASTDDSYRVIQCRAGINLFGNPFPDQLRKWIDAGDYDIVHAHTPPQVPAGQALGICKRKGIPSVLTYHCDGEVRHGYEKWLIPVYMNTFGHRMLDNANTIIATTRSYASNSPYLKNRDVAVVPTGVDTCTFNPDIDPQEVREKYDIKDRLVVGFVGRLVRHKRVDVLLDALNSLDRKRVFCFIIGDGYMSNALKKRAAERDQTNMEFTGFVDGSMLPKYYSAMDVYVLPSASREEAFGSSVIEAMACGKPVIVSDLEWLSEVTGTGCGLSFARNDAASLRDRLELLIGNMELRKTMGVRARKRAVSSYDWDNVAGQIDAIYREAIG